jgi:hypothetical protein
MRPLLARLTHLLRMHLAAFSSSLPVPTQVRWARDRRQCDAVARGRAAEVRGRAAARMPRLVLAPALPAARAAAERPRTLALLDAAPCALPSLVALAAAALPPWLPPPSPSPPSPSSFSQP